jgi:hypothetical protein
MTMTTITLILISLCLFVSVLNLVFTLLLSNSMFRVVKTIIGQEPVAVSSQTQDTGLVDVANVPTYDTRFRNPKKQN